MKLIILILILLAPFAGAAEFNETFVDNYINKVVVKVNNNPLYLDFINASGYKTVKVVVEDKDYYFRYDSKVSVIDPAGYDIRVKVSYDDFMRAVEARKDKATLEYIAFKVIPFKVKLKLLIQCLRTDWCRRKI